MEEAETIRLGTYKDPKKCWLQETLFKYEGRGADRRRVGKQTTEDLRIRGFPGLRDYQTKQSSQQGILPELCHGGEGPTHEEAKATLNMYICINKASEYTNQN